jgi:hypothetical protein
MQRNNRKIFFKEMGMTVNDMLHDFVLQLLRRGFTVPQVAQALADQKVKLMQADEYLAAAEESKLAP